MKFKMSQSNSKFKLSSFIQTWHLIGTICAVVSFPVLFLPPFGLSVEGSDCHQKVNETKEVTAYNEATHLVHECEGDGELSVFAYYAAFMVLFQFGWASVQISHLSILSEIALCEATQTTLNAVRNAATVMSSIFVYCIALIFFKMGTLKLYLLRNSQYKIENSFTLQYTF